MFRADISTTGAFGWEFDDFEPIVSQSLISAGFSIYETGHRYLIQLAQILVEGPRL